MENRVKVPQNIENMTTIWSSNNIFGNISKENEIRISKRYLHSYVHCNIIQLFKIAKIWKQPECPSMDEWTKKMWNTHTRMQTLRPLCEVKQVRQRITGAVRSHLQWKWKSLSPVQLCNSMEFSRPEYWGGCLSLLQGIFPTQGSNPGLPHCREFLYKLPREAPEYWSG